MIGVDLGAMTAVGFLLNARWEPVRSSATTKASRSIHAEIELNAGSRSMSRLFAPDRSRRGRGAQRSSTAGRSRD